MSVRSSYFFFILDPIIFPDLKNVYGNFVNAIYKSSKFSILAQKLDFEGEKLLINQQLQNVDDFVAQEIAASEDSGSDQISFDFYFDDQKEVDISLSLSISDSILLLRVNYVFFSRNDYTQAITDFWMKTYSYFHPKYGYGIAEPTDWPTPERRKRFEQGEIDTIYCYNFLGPRIVRNYGVELLYKTPAWKIEDLSDGGVFVALEFNPLLPDTFKDRYGKTAQMLGISRFIRAG